MYYLNILLSKFKYRDRSKIITDVLDTLRANPRGKRITNIMQGAHLNFEQTSRYLDVMLMTGLIKADGPRYRVTEKGLRLAEDLENLHVVLKVLYHQPY